MAARPLARAALSLGCAALCFMAVPAALAGAEDPDPAVPTSPIVCMPIDAPTVDTTDPVDAVVDPITDVDPVEITDPVETTIDTTVVPCWFEPLPIDACAEQPRIHIDPIITEPPALELPVDESTESTDTTVDGSTDSTDITIVPSDDPRVIWYCVDVVAVPVDEPFDPSALPTRWVYDRNPLLRSASIGAVTPPSAADAMPAPDAPAIPVFAG